MPMTPSFEEDIKKVISLISLAVLPLTLCLMLPVFLQNIVMEKEQKLIESMKMNGLRMVNYWIINFVFDYVFYTVTLIVFVLFGIYVVQMEILTSTSPLLLLILFATWGAN
jgi:hypothetical protein